MISMAPIFGVTRKATGSSAAEGVTIDSAGNIYGAEVGPKRLMKYTKN